MKLSPCPTLTLQPQPLASTARGSRVSEGGQWWEPQAEPWRAGAESPRDGRLPDCRGVGRPPEDGPGACACVCVCTRACVCACTRCSQPGQGRPTSGDSGLSSRPGLPTWRSPLHSPGRSGPATGPAHLTEVQTEVPRSRVLSPDQSSSLCWDWRDLLGGGDGSAVPLGATYLALWADGELHARRPGAGAPGGQGAGVQGAWVCLLAPPRDPHSAL